MTITINRASFIATGEVEKRGEWAMEVGTIEATFAGRTHTIKANRFDDGDILLIGFIGRYRTGDKAWPATVNFRGSSSEKPFVDFGRDDRAGRFHKQNMISYTGV